MSESSGKNSKKFHLDLEKELKDLEGEIPASYDSELNSINKGMSSSENRSSSRVSHKGNYNNNGSVLLFLKSVDKTEREIEKLEKSINKSPIKRNNNNSIQTLDDIKAKLIVERQNNYSLKKENENLKRKLNFKANVTEELGSLQEDFESLKDSFKRSENIRKKQKKIINDLKGELVNSKKIKKPQKPSVKILHKKKRKNS